MQDNPSNTFVPPQPLKTGVLLLIFNRLDTAKQVFEAIRKVRPPRLYVAADGPRYFHPGEDTKVNAVRNYVMDHINWDCEVKTLFREKNLGCKYAVSGGISWFFENEEMGIILEDDCMPHPDFFTFCESLLDRYQYDEHVWVITGNNFQNGKWRGNSSYYFSKYNHCWGWASWRRAWLHYHGDLPFWPEWKNSSDWLKKTPDKVEQRYWSNIFESVRLNEIDSWAYPWTASVWYHNGLTATPNVNLVTNIGFGNDATHTISTESMALTSHSLGPLIHPEKIEQDKKADRYVFDHHFGGQRLRLHWRMLNFPRRIAGKIVRTISG
jgi:hypothetical protein